MSLESEARLRAILDTEPECVKVLAEDGRITDINPAGLRMIEVGHASDLAGRELVDFVRPEHRATFRLNVAQVLAGESRTFEFEIEGARGTRRWLESHAAPLRMPGNPRVHVIAVTRDVTMQKATEAQLRRLNHMHSVLSAINSLIVRVRSRDELLQEACRIATHQGQFSLAWIGLLDRHTMRIEPRARSTPAAAFAPRLPGAAAIAVGDRDSPFIQEAVRTASLAVATEAELQPFAKMSLHAAAALPLVAEGEVAGVMVLYSAVPGFFADPEEARLLGDLAGAISFALAHLAMRVRSEFLALHDPVTALPNRALLVDRIGQALRGRGSGGPPIAVVFLNIERFRHLIESVGRQVGDELLRRVSERLRSVARREDTVARVGERRFGMLLERITDPTHAAALVSERVLAAFDRPVSAGGQEFRLVAKAGIAIADGDGADAETLCANAESALRTVRGTTRRLTFHSPEMNNRIAQALALERRLREALERGELRLLYQPMVEAKSGRLTRLEALMRWEDSERGLVPPAEFVPLMEETGLIVDAGRWALAQVERDVAAWRAQGLEPPPVAVNVSAVQLHHPDFVADFRASLARLGGAHGPLAIEITESAVMHDVAGAASSLEILRALGVGTAVDDFGTGYSSLAYVATLPIESIKIDRSFVARLGDDHVSRTIVTTVVALGRALGLRVIAEGVESAEHCRLLAELGCDELQGFAIGAPATADAVGERLGHSTRAGGA